jgi:hypothetical protein
LPIVAQVLKGIEKDNTLRKRYLTSFELPYVDDSFMDCEPYREIGIEGLFNRLFNSDVKKEVDKAKKNKKPVKKSFFEKLFKKKQ